LANYRSRNQPTIFSDEPLLKVTGELEAATAVIPITKQARDTRSAFILQSSFGVLSFHAMIGAARQKRNGSAFGHTDRALSDSANLTIKKGMGLG
jgi:hypothetical protein